MEAQTSQLNLYQKLANIRKSLEVIKKNKSGYGYKYVSEDEILARLSVGMEKYHLLLIPSVVPETPKACPVHYMKTKSNKDGTIYEEHVNETEVCAEMTFTWVNADNPQERIEIPWFLVGQQGDGSQAFGSGLSYSMRYFLLKFFNIATPEDDPDKWRSRQKETAQQEGRLIAEQIVKDLDATIRRFLEQNPEKASDVKKYASGFVKGGNYLTITDPVLAAKLLSGFKENFKIEE